MRGVKLYTSFFIFKSAFENLLKLWHGLTYTPSKQCFITGFGTTHNATHTPRCNFHGKKDFEKVSNLEWFYVQKKTRARHILFVHSVYTVKLTFRAFGRAAPETFHECRARCPEKFNKPANSALSTFFLVRCAHISASHKSRAKLLSSHHVLRYFEGCLRCNEGCVRRPLTTPMLL